jgi:hypothetical protein
MVPDDFINGCLIQLYLCPDFKLNLLIVRIADSHGLKFLPKDLLIVRIADSHGLKFLPKDLCSRVSLLKKCIDLSRV